MKNINIKRTMKVGQEVLLGWEAEAAELSLGGKTMDQMKQLADEAQAAIDRLAKLRNEEKAAMVERDAAVISFWEALKRARHAVLSHPRFGGDSALYGRWGYVRDSERSSGLGRKPKDPPGEEVTEEG